MSPLTLKAYEKWGVGGGRPVNPSFPLCCRNHISFVLLSHIRKIPKHSSTATNLLRKNITYKIRENSRNFLWTYLSVNFQPQLRPSVNCLVTVNWEKSPLVKDGDFINLVTAGAESAVSYFKFQQRSRCEYHCRTNSHLSRPLIFGHNVFVWLRCSRHY